MSAAIEKATPQHLATTEGDWSRERLDLLKAQLCPQGISDGEFALYWQGCKARGLDPFKNEVYCVPRNQGGKKMNVLQVSVEGMRTRAMRFGDLLSYAKDFVCEKDVCVVDRAAGTVAHRYDASKPRGALMGAWARVVRRGMDPFLVYLPAGSRTVGQAYNSAGTGEHLAKCAVAAALRDAYPDAFGGLYTAEEMPPEREATPLEAALAGGAKGTVTVLPPEPGPVVEFGEWKHRPIAGLTQEEARAAVAFADEKLANAKPKATWVVALKGNRDAIASAHGLAEDRRLSPTPEAIADGRERWKEQHGSYPETLPHEFSDEQVKEMVARGEIKVEGAGKWEPSPEEKAAILKGESNAE